MVKGFHSSTRFPFFNFAGKESPYLLARISNSFLKFSKSLTSKPLGKITSPNESSWDHFHQLEILKKKSVLA